MRIRVFKTTLGFDLDHGGQHEVRLILLYTFEAGRPADRGNSGCADTVEIVSAKIAGIVEADVPDWLMSVIATDATLLTTLCAVARDNDRADEAEPAQREQDGHELRRAA
ncbi:hypothetical protein MMMDOFMJ_0130 [Methylobacterium gnaphalii]|uniref:Uncharacterized protein n=2 Tax=Methylobacterium gnaphalii TaxID=1010610 RepID=A0A512JIS7_9HYPH|nr:hypothetical protein MGN01_17130 [Methylobacterium gnaphalii]GJD67216.1 hypothetical protein MMMDOFMJ_0130 [Methylobacterium gnaphalii]GLS49897.1 hypothetical protein GCM10007885_27490 [Methylobacterium gnaphalii]